MFWNIRRYMLLAEPLLLFFKNELFIDTYLNCKKNIHLGCKMMVSSMKDYSYTPILGWSSTRYDCFRMCKRKYYYTYYGKHDDVIKVLKINNLKRLTSIPLVVGTIVHDIMKTMLERFKVQTGPINEKGLMDFARRKTEMKIGESKFREVYYNELDDVSVEGLYEQTVNCLRNFLDSDRLNEIRQQAIEAKGKWVIEPSKYGETRIGGLKAFCKVDFLYFEKNKIIILDWKTGKKNDLKYRTQMVGYSTWAATEFDHHPEKIFPTLVFLKDEYSELEIKVNEFDVQEFTSRICEETEEMYSYCDDPEYNIPKQKQRFNKCSNPGICELCNYLELCG